MAEIVLAAGTSHSPLLTLPASEWKVRAESDYENGQLNTSDGRWINYETLLREVGGRYADRIKQSDFEELNRRSQNALDRMASDIAQASPDVVIIVGDDQGELFTLANQPALSIFYGEELLTSDAFGKDGQPSWVHHMGQGYLMDAIHSVPGHPPLALDLIGGLLDRDVDVATCSHVPDPGKTGFGHAFGFIVKRLFQGRSIPVVPVLLNTYFPPNVLSSRRCFDVGRALCAAVRSSTLNLRVAVIASGGLSHFIVDEELDVRVLKGLDGAANLLTTIPREALNSGSSEILNWVLMAGAAEGLEMQWSEYQPAYRTAAGTGVGMGFAVLS